MLRDIETIECIVVRSRHSVCDRGAAQGFHHWRNIVRDDTEVVKTMRISRSPSFAQSGYNRGGSVCGRGPAPAMPSHRAAAKALAPQQRHRPGAHKGCPPWPGRQV
jgi:hypothetical protein